MPNVKAFKIAGIKCWFWSNDHEPPHFHAKKSGVWEYRVYFLNDRADMLELKWRSGHLSSRDRQRLLEAAEQYRYALLQQWQDIQEAQRG